MSVLPEKAPAGWRVLPFGRVVHRSKEAGRPDLQPLSVFLDDGVVPRSSREDNHNRLGAEMSNYLVVRPADIVFNKLRTWQGGLGVSRFEGIASPAYFVCRPIETVDSRYYHYLLRSHLYLAELTRLSKFMPPAQFDIGWDELRSMRVTVPPLAEQRAIADYLDTETARIDALITKKRRLVDLLDERIDALLMAHIARSSMVASGGTVLEPIRRLLRRVDRPPSADGEMITAFRDGQVTTRSARGREGFTDSWTDGAKIQGVRVNDVVVHGLDGFSGAIGCAERSGVCSPVYHVCVPSGVGDPLFYGRFLRLLATTGYLGNFAVSTRERAVDFRNWDLFGRIPIAVVPPSEQASVGKLIERVCSLRPLVDASAALAVEHRQALITAAVTGELAIPGAA